MDDIETAAGKADIISSATFAAEALVKGAWLREGTHVDLIGGLAPQMREADDLAIRSARLCVDTLDAVHEAGDLVQPLQNGAIAPDHIKGTLADLCAGRAGGRADDSEITCFKAVGSALADLVAARLVYEGHRPH